METPVYLFTGFLESGKTKMIHETLTDKRFQDKEKTLLLVCEEGITEYDIKKYKGKVIIKNVDKESDITKENLLKWKNESGCDRVLIEYNGMWNTAALYDRFPENWFVYQEVMTVDSSTFEIYNANMRSLMVDKLQGCSFVFFNRCTDDTDIMRLHKEARALNRGVGIVYEYADGRIQQDNIQDPLPFDINADVIEIKDEDYAVWYRDMAEDLTKYVGKTIKVKGMVARDSKLPKNSFALGRMVMTCCADDLAFHGVINVADKDLELENGQWLEVTAKFEKEWHKLYNAEGPIFYVQNISETTQPENPVATYF